MIVPGRRSSNLEGHDDRRDRIARRPGAFEVRAACRTRGGTHRQRRRAPSATSVRSRPSASVSPRPTSCHSFSAAARSSTTGTPAAGRPRAVSSTCVVMRAFTRAAMYHERSPMAWQRRHVHGRSSRPAGGAAKRSIGRRPRAPRGSSSARGRAASARIRGDGMPMLQRRADRPRIPRRDRGRRGRRPGPARSTPLRASRPASRAGAAAIHLASRSSGTPRAAAPVQTAASPSCSDAMPPHARTKSPSSRCFSAGGDGE